jgi:ribosomal protein S18 acetylase RimI-like enzyme
MKTDTITIRSANPNDLDAICLLAEEIVESHSQAAPHVFAPLPGSQRDRDFWQSTLVGEGQTVMVAAENGQLQGFITARMLPPNPLSFILPRIVCAIGTIVVARTHHRRGIGQQLLQAVEAWAAQHGAVEIKLEVFDFNRGAIALYENDGFKAQSHILTKAIGN